MAEGTKLIAHNRNARRNYEFLETLEAGLSLMGSEVKSLRDGKVSFKDGYVTIRGGQAFLVGVHIAPYENASWTGHEAERERKLLLHGREIAKLSAQMEQKGLTVVPVRFYLKRGRIKLEIALAKGKKTFDKREDLKRRDMERDTARQLAAYK